MLEYLEASGLSPEYEKVVEAWRRLLDAVSALTLSKEGRPDDEPRNDR